MGRARRWPAVLAAAAAALALSGCFDTGVVPITGFDVSPDRAEPDQRVTFDGRHSSDQNSFPQSTKVNWDLDGDGIYETFTGLGYGALFAATSYPTPGVYGVGLDVGYPAGFIPGALFATAGIQVFLHHYFARNVTVVAPQPPSGNQPPTAAFRHDADPGHEGTAVRFDAAESKDPDGGPLTYEWDFGDTHSSDEALTTKEPSAAHLYDFPGEYIARLRVFDETGLMAETKRMVQVVAGKPPSADAPTARAAASLPFALTMQPAAMMDEGTASVTNGALLRTGIVVRGRLTLGRRLAAPLRGTRKPNWIARFMVKQRGRMGTGALAVEGQMLLDFGGGTRICTATRATAPRNGPARGLLAVIGGSGAGARVGGTGAFAVSLKNAMGVNGRLRLSAGQAARPLPAECRTLARIARRGR